MTSRNPKFTLLATSGVAALFFIAAPATAQTEPTSPDDKTDRVVVTGRQDYVLPESSAATKTDTPVLLTPQSVQVVPRAVLNDQRAVTLTDAVRNVAGVSSDFGFNGSTQPLLVLRGFSSVSMTALGSMSGASTYYLDGVKVAGLPIDMSNVEAVEVVKGPNSVLFGRSEPGGVVNVVSRPFSETPRFSAEQTVGSYGLSRTSANGATTLDADKTWRVRGSASYYTTDSNRDFVEERLGAVSGGVAWVPDDRTSVSLTLGYIDQKYRSDYGVPSDGNRPANLPDSRQFNDAPELSSVESLSALIEATHKFSDDWEIKAKFLALRADTREVDVGTYRFDLGLNPGQTCDGTGADLCRYYFNARPDGDLDVNQATIDLFGKVETGAWTHHLLFGVDGYETEKSGLAYLQQLTSVNVANPVLGPTPALDPALAIPVDMLEWNRWASVYAQDQIDFGGGLHGILAVRQDWTSAIYAAPGTEPNRISSTTPRVGVVWEFQPGQSIYTQYQEALSANNGRDPISGAELDPEKSRQTEVGYKIVTADGRLIATLAAYELTKRNRADLTLFPIIQTIGTARSRGIELDVIGQITPDLALLGSYSYVDAKVTDDGPYAGTRLANVPYNSGSIWARYTIDQNWAIGGGIFYQGEREGDIANTFQLPGYTRVDLMAAYDFLAFGNSASLQFNLNNAFDERYYASSHQFSPDWILPGAPRSISATLRIGG
ncbi:MAG: TonB-dependent siderophore receptor [Hyphomonadaceae bacterium]